VYINFSRKENLKPKNTNKSNLFEHTLFLGREACKQ
jgi:hypothetical protein